MNFEVTSPPHVLFGAGTLERAGELAARYGRRAWLVTGAGALERAGVIERLERLLAAHGVSAARQPVAHEPETADADRGARAAHEAGCEVVIGIGGGSALDAAKAVACLLANAGEALDYLEVVGRGRPIERPALPWIAIPTTGGTGSEAARNAVLADRATGTKASLRHESLLPRVAILDPTLTYSVPPDVTARTGLDALVQLIEPYVSRRRHPLVDALALEGLRRGARALPRAFADGGDAEAREEMLLAAHWSGVALTHGGLGAAHAFAGPLGGGYGVPHGIACAATIPHVMAANLEAAARDPAATETVRRYAAVAVALGAGEAASDLDTAQLGIECMAGLCRTLGVPALRSLGVTPAAIPDLVMRARRTSSMKANPVELSDAELAQILERAIGAA
jgi:alcohol dehydrogenase class IV